MKLKNLRSEEMIRVLENDGREQSTSLGVRELVERIKEDGDDEAEETLVVLLGENGNAERYIAYSWLKGMKLRGLGLDAAILAFETDPANRRFIEYWHESSTSLN